MAEPKLSSGVQELINRLREKGLAEGRREGEKIIAKAHQKAKEIVDQAHFEGEAIRKKAHHDAEHYRKSAHEAVQLAARDTMLNLKSTLSRQFAQRIGELVEETFHEEDFLKQVIMEVAGHALPEGKKDQRMEIILPADVVGLDELRRHPEKVKQGSLGQYMLATAEKQFREGVSLRTSEEQKGGITIKLVDEEVSIDLSDEAITELLLAHLLPRFRALIEGSIQ
jgi:V/A-type H+-transporting ATPase subunit E